MAATNENSDQLDRIELPPYRRVAVTDWYGKFRMLRFAFTQGADAGDAGSTARLVLLPPGPCRLILPLSRLVFSAMGTARTMDLGWEAYTERDGDAIVADENGLDDGVDVASAGSVVPGGTLGGDETMLFESKKGVILTAQINDGTLPAAATLGGYFVYVVE